MKVLYRRLRGMPLVNRAGTATVRRLWPGDPTFWVDHLPRHGLAAARLPHGQELRLLGAEAEAIANLLYWHGWAGPDPETAPVFYALAREARVVIDVGAHVGYFSLLAGLANPRAFVFALEPIPHIVQRLRYHLQLNGVSGVEVVESAAGRAHGSARCWYSTEIPLPSSSGLAPEVLGQSAGTSVVVPVIPVDALVRERSLDAVDLVKIDTESTEPDVLAGMAVSLKHHRPAVVCEVLPGTGTQGPIEDLFRSLDYRPYHLRSEGAQPCAAVVPHASFRNYLFLPSERDLPPLA